MGADGHSFGDRNSPTIAYASFTPEFHIAANGEAVGGFFWDGRARTLEEQAGGPPLNPIEMGMPDKPSVVARPQGVTRGWRARSARCSARPCSTIPIGRSPP